MQYKSKHMPSNLLILFLIFMALLYPMLGCEKAQPSFKIPDDAVLLTDYRAIELFVDKRQWNMPQLQEHELYLLDERLYVEFLFEKMQTKVRLTGRAVFH